MRRTFVDALKEGGIDIQNEYKKLYNLVYTRHCNSYDQTLREVLEDRFINFWFRGTCTELDEFDRMHNFQFEENPKAIDVDYLVSFCEYYRNMIDALIVLENNSFVIGFDDPDYKVCEEQIRVVIEAIGYHSVTQDSHTLYVAKSASAIAAAESPSVPDDMSYMVLAYNHSSLKGNPEKKKEILLRFASLFEPLRENLKTANGKLCENLFFAFNNLNIRHNNVDENDASKYKKKVAEMSSEELEEWYDEVYQMCFLGVLELDQIERNDKFRTMKDDMQGA